MRKIALLICVFLNLIAIPASADNLIGDKVVLRALDKVTATTQDYTVAVGESLKYGSLDIAVRHCEKRPPEETPETYAFLQITNVNSSIQQPEILSSENMNGEEAQAKLFSGWMFASSPAMSSLEHAVYDIWVLDCIVPIQPDALTDLENTESK